MESKQLLDWKRKKSEVEKGIRLLEEKRRRTFTALGGDKLKAGVRFSGKRKESTCLLAQLSRQEARELRKAEQELRDIEQKILSLTVQENCGKRNRAVAFLAIIFIFLIFGHSIYSYMNNDFASASASISQVSVVQDVVAGGEDISYLARVRAFLLGESNSLTGGFIGIKGELSLHACNYESCCCGGFGGYESTVTGFCYSGEFPCLNQLDTCGAGCSSSSSSSTSSGGGTANLIDDSFSCDQNSIPVGTTTACTGSYSNNESVEGNFTLKLQYPSATDITTSCTGKYFKMSSISYSAPCDSDDGSEITCNDWNSTHDDISVQWTIEGCSATSAKSVDTECGAGESCSFDNSASVEVTPAADNATCGSVVSDIKLNTSVTNETVCFTAAANNIVIDCDEYTITYGTGGVSGLGVDNSGSYSNVTIQNCVMVEGSSSGSSKHGISFSGASSGTILNDTFHLQGSGSRAMSLTSSSNSNTIQNNVINITGASAQGINLFASDSNRIFDNSINITGASSDGIKLTSTSQENLLYNNNITADSGNEIIDTTGSSYINRIVYNNTRGEIVWTNTSSNGFLYDLTLNVSNELGIGLKGLNLNIGSNVISLNTSAFDRGMINSSANITLKSISADTINHIMKKSGYSTDSRDIIENGTSCILDETCTQISFSGGTLKFNTTSFSSFAANNPPGVSNLVLNTTDRSTNDTNQNLTAFFTVADNDNNPVKNITNWYLNDTSIMVLNMSFERVDANDSDNAQDYSPNEYNGTEYGGVLFNESGGADGKSAYEYDGSDDYIERGSQVISSYPFTIAAWIKTNVSAAQTIVSLVDKDAANVMYTMGVTSSGGINSAASNGSASQDGGSSSGKDDNQWHYFAVVFENASSRVLYIDGSSPGSKTTEVSFNTAVDRISIGRRGDSSASHYFNGTIDDLQIYNRSLSSQQIAALYNNRTDLMVSQELSAGEWWNISVTPNDGIEDGATAMSENVTVEAVSGNNAPGAPELVSPENGSSITNRTPQFIWNNSVDADSDTLTYHVLVDDDSSFNNPEINVSSISEGSTNTSYDSETTLDVDTLYYWKVRANDSTEYGEYSGVFNFTLISYLLITLTTDTVAFGTMGPGDTNNTTVGSPQPFRAENNGNIVANVSINATTYFSSALARMPSSYYQFKIRENESGSFDTTDSNTTWINMTNSTGTYNVINLSWQDSGNDFLADLLVTVPSDEPAGAKSSTVTFTIETGT